MWRCRQDGSRCCRPVAANHCAFNSGTRAPGLTVVVSPLIALMKDQVDALQAGGCVGDVSSIPLSPLVIHVPDAWFA